MKKFLVCLLAMGTAYFASAQKPTKVEVKTTSKKSVDKVFFLYRKDDDMVTDSAQFKNGVVVFTPALNEPTLVYVRLKYHPDSSLMKDGEMPKGNQLYETGLYYAEPGLLQINISDSLKNAMVKGGTAQKDYAKLTDLLKPYNEKSQALSKEYMDYRKNKDEAGMDRVEAEFEKLDSVMKTDVYLKFLNGNPKSPIAIYVLGNYAGYDIDPAVISPLFDKLSPQVKSTTSGKAFADRIEVAKKTAVGAMAMDFTQNDTLDKPVSLHDFKGKYVLVDFWASWCGPCRAENPNVVKAFNQYKDKNFTVLGVSLDQPGKKQAWLDAIHADDLTWTHVSDLQFWNNAVAKQYGIRAIPQNLLIDPSGKIIAKNIRGEELGKKLSEVLD